MTFHPEFVELMPAKLEEGVLYVSMIHAVAIHKCACGCGEKVVTPLDPSDWTLTFDGITISLYPSIGNWNFGCRSHYFITNNQAQFCMFRNNDDDRDKRKTIKQWLKNLFSKKEY